MPIPTPEANRLDRSAHTAGYEYLGGLTNRVYLNRSQQEILKLAVTADTEERQERLAGFQQCQAISREYALLGIMPPVYEVGSDWQGSGCPYLREQYVPGVNMGVAYLKDPTFWRERLPEGLARIYETIQATEGVNIVETWRDKLAGMEYPEGFEDWYEIVRGAGEKLMRSQPMGWRIHGDLQFGNILARRDALGTIMLIDWEVSEAMPLGYEFAMLYTFLADPDGQVDAPLQDAYRRRAPLSEMWQGVAAVLLSRLGLEPDVIHNSIRFRMGNAWLYQLTRALDAGNAARAAELKQQLEALLGGSYFAMMPVTK